MGAYTRKDKKEIEESLANVYKRFPRLEEREKPDGRNSEWWRTADACNGACIDVKSRRSS
mgnify:FL=1